MVVVPAPSGAAHSGAGSDTHASDTAGATVCASRCQMGTGANHRLTLSWLGRIMVRLPLCAGLLNEQAGGGDLHPVGVGAEKALQVALGSALHACGDGRIGLMLERHLRARHEHAEDRHLLVHLAPRARARAGEGRIAVDDDAHLLDQRLEMRVRKIFVAVGHQAAREESGHGAAGVEPRHAEAVFDLVVGVEQIAERALDLGPPIGRVLRGELAGEHAAPAARDHGVAARYRRAARGAAAAAFVRVLQHLADQQRLGRIVRQRFERALVRPPGARHGERRQRGQCEAREGPARRPCDVHDHLLCCRIGARSLPRACRRALPSGDGRQRPGGPAFRRPRPANYCLRAAVARPSPIDLTTLLNASCSMLNILLVPFSSCVTAVISLAASGLLSPDRSVILFDSSTILAALSPATSPIARASASSQLPAPFFLPPPALASFCSSSLHLLTRSFTSSCTKSWIVPCTPLSEPTWWSHFGSDGWVLPPTACFTMLPM